ncbi:MAG: SIMPL domain-containing protein [Hyphomicrobiales bacterium]|nr:SIMPL domain-containing protein [Hyphomicrobiales bacterium]
MKNINMMAVVLAAGLLGAGIATSGYFISSTIYKSNIGINTAEAKGLAERRVTSNRANWEISFNVNAGANVVIKNLYARFEDHQKIIIDELKKAGFSDDEITIGAADYYGRVFRDDNQQIVDRSYSLTGLVSIATTNVPLVAKARVNVGKLIAQGISLDNRSPTYQFTNLNAIKPEMLKEATENARIAAATFAENVGAKVGGIRSARQGGFNITDAGAEYGDRNKIEKNVRVVTTVTFYIEN